METINSLKFYFHLIIKIKIMIVCLKTNEVGCRKIETEFKE